MLLLAGSANGQEARIIRGQVVHAGTGAPVPGAAVAEVGRDGNAALAGANGSFALRVGGGALRLTAAAVGLAPDMIQIGHHETAATFRLHQKHLTLPPLVVAAERSFSAASSSAIRDVDSHLRPRDSSQDLLRLVPGLVIAQHGGGGKAEQIFLRGFDVDHGTDVAISVDGTPVNMVSHAHGQGYSDLHFLIPEVVERVDVRKGPYDARDGDFATAGAVEFRTRDRLPQGVAALRAGSFATRDFLAMFPLGGGLGERGGYVAIAGRRAAGFSEIPQSHQRLNAFAKWTAPIVAGAELFASMSAFAARWDQTGQIPERILGKHPSGRFSAVDSTEGGRTDRYDVSVGVRSTAAADRPQWEAGLYGARYRFQLFSNFTFFLNDSINGDGIEQADDRYLAGFHARYRWREGQIGRWSLGVGGRTDHAAVGLHDQRRRERLMTRRDDDISQQHLFGWAQYDLDVSQRARLQLGVRSDRFRFDVADRLPIQPDRPRSSGTGWRSIVSPKASLALAITPATRLFANAGTGFHSNHARDVILAAPGDRVLPRAVGGELGWRYSSERGSLAVAVWLMDMQSELVYVGDEGVTERSGRTRRGGADAEARVRILPWLWADADLNLSRGRLRDEPSGADRIPLAPTLASAGGLTIRDLGGFGGGARYRLVGDRAADESASVIAHGHALWDVFGTWTQGDVELFGSVENLTNAAWNEAQFATTSRLRGEPAAVTELHFTSGAPRRIRVGLEYRF